MKYRLAAFAATVMLLTVLPMVNADDDNNWLRVKLDERFRSEGVAAADLNKDGTPDVIAGDVWYEAPRADAENYADGTAWKIQNSSEQTGIQNKTPWRALMSSDGLGQLMLVNPCSFHRKINRDNMCGIVYHNYHSEI